MSGLDALRAVQLGLSRALRGRWRTIDPGHPTVSFVRPGTRANRWSCVEVPGAISDMVEVHATKSTRLVRRKDVDMDEEEEENLVM